MRVPPVSAPAPAGSSRGANTVLLLRRDELQAVVADLLRSGDVLANDNGQRDDLEETREVMSREYLAEWLGISTKTVSALVKHQGLPCAKLGKEYRFIRADVVDWMRGEGSDVAEEETK